MERPINNTNQISRITSTSNGMGFGLGVLAFVGAEYFFAPKFSISGEFTYGLTLNTQGDGESTTESWDTGGFVKSETTKTGGTSAFGFDTGVSGVLSVNMYF